MNRVWKGRREESLRGVFETRAAYNSRSLLSFYSSMQGYQERYPALVDTSALLRSTSQSLSGVRGIRIRHTGHHRFLMAGVPTQGRSSTGVSALPTSLSQSIVIRWQRNPNPSYRAPRAQWPESLLEVGASSELSDPFHSIAFIIGGSL